MKECTKKLFGKLAELTGKKCGECPPSKSGEAPHRCCDKMFCTMNLAFMKGKGLEAVAQPNVAGIPFMGEAGCVLAPEQRPYCTGFVCPPHFGDRGFRREYDRLLNKISRDPGAPPMPTITSKNRQQFDDKAMEMYAQHLAPKRAASLDSLGKDRKC